jgi:hypothetical protein
MLNRCLVRLDFCEHDFLASQPQVHLFTTLHAHQTLYFMTDICDAFTAELRATLHLQKLFYFMWALRR